MSKLICKYPLVSSFHLAFAITCCLSFLSLRVIYFLFAIVLAINLQKEPLKDSKT